MFCMEFILHEILKYKLNNLLIFLNVVCFYFACYSSILVGAVGLSQYYASPVQCRGFRKFGWGVRGVRQFSKFQGGGGAALVEKFSGSRGVRIYGGLANFQDPGGMAYVGQ